MGWFIGLAVKPLLGMAFMAALLLAARALAGAVHALLPEGRVKRELFNGWRRSPP